MSGLDKKDIKSIRGKKFRNVIPTYHPGYVLRNPSERLVVIRDMKKAAQELMSTNATSIVNCKKKTKGGTTSLNTERLLNEVSNK